MSSSQEESEDEFQFQAPLSNEKNRQMCQYLQQKYNFDFGHGKQTTAEKKYWADILAKGEALRPKTEGVPCQETPFTDKENPYIGYCRTLLRNRKASSSKRTKGSIKLCMADKGWNAVPKNFGFYKQGTLEKIAFEPKWKEWSTGKPAPKIGHFNAYMAKQKWFMIAYYEGPGTTADNIIKDYRIKVCDKKTAEEMCSQRKRKRAQEEEEFSGSDIAEDREDDEEEETEDLAPQSESIMRYMDRLGWDIDEDGFSKGSQYIPTIIAFEMYYFQVDSPTADVLVSNYMTRLGYTRGTGKGHFVWFNKSYTKSVPLAITKYMYLNQKDNGEDPSVCSSYITDLGWRRFGKKYYEKNGQRITEDIVKDMCRSGATLPRRTIERDTQFQQIVQEARPLQEVQRQFQQDDGHFQQIVQEARQQVERHFQQDDGHFQQVERQIRQVARPIQPVERQISQPVKPVERQISQPVKPVERQIRQVARPIQPVERRQVARPIPKVSPTIAQSHRRQPANPKNTLSKPYQSPKWWYNFKYNKYPSPGDIKAWQQENIRRRYKLGSSF
jgi:hypothetical protein